MVETNTSGSSEKSTEKNDATSQGSGAHILSKDELDMLTNNDHDDTSDQPTKTKLFFTDLRETLNAIYIKPFADKFRNIRHELSLEIQKAQQRKLKNKGQTIERTKLPEKFSASVQGGLDQMRAHDPVTRRLLDFDKSPAVNAYRKHKLNKEFKRLNKLESEFMDDPQRDIAKALNNSNHQAHNIAGSLNDINKRQKWENGFLNRVILSPINHLAKRTTLAFAIAGGVYGGMALNDYREDPEKDIADIPQDVVRWGDEHPEYSEPVKTVLEPVLDTVDNITRFFGGEAELPEPAYTPTPPNTQIPSTQDPQPDSLNHDG